MKQLKVAVLCARHDASKDVIPAQSCIEMILTNHNRTSVLDYWESVTNHHLDFVGSAVFPWVDITITADDIDPINGNVPRDIQCSRAYEATKALNGGDLEGFDLFVVLTLPGQLSLPNALAEFLLGQPQTIVVPFDGGAGAQVQGKPACALPVVSSNHTFMCHEVGHLLNWRHSYGVLNNGIDWDGAAPFSQGEVYGDPYDIMSSATFGSRTLDPKVTHYSGNPEFVGPAVDGWPNPKAFVMGPAPARAHVHLWDPQALPPEHVHHFGVPQVGDTLRFTLVAAGRSGKQLAILHPWGEDADGRGRCYVEYRQKGGWDAGLDESGNDLARQGVVVHTLADTAEGVRCWYRGRVLVPVELDSDVTVPGTPMQVRVVSSDVEQRTVDIEVTARLVRGVDIRTRGSDEILTVINPQSLTTPCGDPITYGTWITQTHYFFQPVSYGFGGAGAPDAKPLIAGWTVAGVKIAGPNGSIEAPTPEGTFTIQYSLDPVTAELGLFSRGGEQYRVDVTVAMSEADGSGTTLAAAVFRAKGFFDGYGPGDQQEIDRCMFRYAKSARLRLRDYLIPPGPDPFRRELTDQINQARMTQVIGQIANSHPGPANALSALTALRFGVGPNAPAAAFFGIRARPTPAPAPTTGYDENRPSASAARLPRRS